MIGECGMTYKIEQYVAKITSPIIVRIGAEEMAFTNGTDLAEHSFDRCLVIDSIRGEESKIIITLVENTRVNDTNWVGEEQAGFF